jgi:hypothetical protein
MSSAAAQYPLPGEYEACERRGRFAGGRGFVAPATPESFALAPLFDLFLDGSIVGALTPRWTHRPKSQ